MKVCLIQPLYSVDYSKSDEYFNIECELLDKCDETMDIIVLPEMTDMPCLCKTKEERLLSIEKYNRAILEKAAQTAKRCNSILFINARYKNEKGYRNTTYAFDRNGEIKGLYFKKQLVPNEMKHEETDISYVFEHEEPTVIEIEGIRFGFLICYDFYFYENFANMARYNPDVIIGCSHQRSDTHRALELSSGFLAYNTNAYVLRSSVSMDENSHIGGGSMVVAPDGEVLLNMKSRVGLETVEIDISKKYFKPAGFGNPPSAHHEYIEKGRRPWKYRHAGSAIVPCDDEMSYPRVCAHGGFSSVAPENSMAAIGAAVAMGADEIEIDLWTTKDGELVAVSDAELDKASDGTGCVYDYTYGELLRFDFGVKYGGEFKGLKIVTLEEILKKFACHVIFNIHIRTADSKCEYSPEIMQKILELIKKYDCGKHIYFTSENDNVLRLIREIAPDICCCVGGGDLPWEAVERAIEYNCKKVQLCKQYFNRETVEKAHSHGIKCNVSFLDDAGEAKAFTDMGADTVITNRFNLVLQAVKN